VTPIREYCCNNHSRCCSSSSCKRHHINTQQTHKSEDENKFLLCLYSHSRSTHLTIENDVSIFRSIFQNIHQISKVLWKINYIQKSKSWLDEEMSIQSVEKEFDDVNVRKVQDFVHQSEPVANTSLCILFVEVCKTKNTFNEICVISGGFSLNKTKLQTWCRVLLES
jgi:hypothetical protein